MAGTRIAIVGDYDHLSNTHQATDDALAHAAADLGLEAATEWIPTEALESAGAVARLLTPYDAVFLGPGAPYRCRDGAFAAVRFARERRRPFFGT